MDTSECLAEIALYHERRCEGRRRVLQKEKRSTHRSADPVGPQPVNCVGPVMCSNQHRAASCEHTIVNEYAPIRRQERLECRRCRDSHVDGPCFWNAPRARRIQCVTHVRVLRWGRRRWWRHLSGRVRVSMGTVRVDDTRNERSRGWPPTSPARPLRHYVSRQAARCPVIRTTTASGRPMGCPISVAGPQCSQ